MRRLRDSSAMILGCALVFAALPVTEGCLFVPSYWCEDNGGADTPCSNYLVPGFPPEDLCRPEAGCSPAPGCRRVFCSELPESQCEAIPRCKFRNGICVWDDFPDPPDPCHLLPQTECSADPSCVWDIACFGEPKRCNSFDDETACNRVPHCRWRRQKTM